MTDTQIELINSVEFWASRIHQQSQYMLSLRYRHARNEISDERYYELGRSAYIIRCRCEEYFHYASLSDEEKYLYVEKWSKLHDDGALIANAMLNFIKN